MKYNKENPIQAQKNMDNFKAALNPATIKKMQIRFPEEFKDIEADSQEMLEAAVELFEMFQLGEWLKKRPLFRRARKCSEQCRPQHNRSRSWEGSPG